MSDKTEEPTPRRLRKAREQGDSPVSGALTQALGFVAVLALTPAALAAVGSRSAGLLRRAIGGTGLALGPFEIAREVLVSALPLIAAGAAAAALAGFVQSGGVVSFQKLVPDASRANPFTGIKGLFSGQHAFGLARALVAAALVGAYALHVVHAELGSLANTVGDLSRAAPLALALGKRIAWFAAFVGLALAAADVLVTQRAWRRRHRMSKGEVKREHRETEGDPELKAARRRAHHEVLAGVAIASVKDATVLIVNPTHLAVALHYVEDAEDAPRVVAQGAGDLARRMIEAAHAYGVPVVRDVPIARALSELEVGDEIPEALYEAVAEILREVWTKTTERP